MTQTLTIPLFCLLLVVGFTSALLLDRLPHRTPSSKFNFQDEEDDDFGGPDSLESEDKRSMNFDRGLKSSWNAFYPFPPDMHAFRSQRKRDTQSKALETSEKDKHDLANILKDDEEEEKQVKKAEEKKGKEMKDPPKHGKTKRQSDEDSEAKPTELKALAETEQAVAPNPDFQDWLRREYYRNMAMSFASMRRKRDGSSRYSEKTHKSRSAPAHKRQKKSVSFEDVTDNLKAIEDVLFMDALQTLKEAEDDYEEDPQKQNRITNDLSSAYDLETMRNALFHLRETLANLDQKPVPERDEEEEPIFKSARKRSDKCPPLDLLTSDCSTLGDIVSEGNLKRLLVHACNWHEVCYTCGEVYGLTSENCDVGFIEQSQTICRGDVPCESTASLLLLPLRQRRVFYKRSNPTVCLMDPCVEEFLKQGQ